MRKLIMAIPLVILLCFTFSCQQVEEVAEEASVDIEAEKANVRTLLDQYVEAWKSLNIDQFSEIFSQDADMFIIDTQKSYVGWESFKEMLQGSIDLISDVNVTFRDSSIKVNHSGTVAWLSTLEDATWTSQGRLNEAKGMRVTWILEKREGKWVIVQGHWSVSEQAETE